MTQRKERLSKGNSVCASNPEKIAQKIDETNATQAFIVKKINESKVFKKKFQGLKRLTDESRISEFRNGKDVDYRHAYCLLKFLYEEDFVEEEWRKWLIWSDEPEDQSEKTESDVGHSETANVEDSSTNDASADEGKFVREKAASNATAAIATSNKSIPASSSTIDTLPGGLAWDKTFQPPNKVVKGNLLPSGELAQPGHLGDGFFCPRYIYSTLADEVEAIIDKPTANKVNMWWLTGGSGTGKSIALLHVLALLFERGYQQIVWLGRRYTNLLPEVMEWAEKIGQEREQPVLIAIDDPCAPAVLESAKQQWDATLSSQSVINAVGRNRSKHLPIVLCCGPTIQYELFRDVVRNNLDILELHTATMPMETADDYAELWQWFCERSETPVDHKLSDVADRSLLLVQVFFEWSRGERLDDFARRFRGNIETVAGLLAEHADYHTSSYTSFINLIDEILALNRLYVDYPKDAINKRLENLEKAKFSQGAEAKVKFDNLMESHSFSLLKDSNQLGFRLLHPGLANALYEVWHPKEIARIHRKRHLLEGVRISLSNEKVEAVNQVLWAISNVLDPKDKVANRLDPSLVRDVVTEIYQEQKDAGIQSWAVWAQLVIDFQDLEESLVLKPSPIWRGINRMPDKYTGQYKDTEHWSTYEIRLYETLLKGFRKLNQQQQVVFCNRLRLILKSASPKIKQSMYWCRFWRELRRYTSKRPAGDGIVNPGEHKL